jgi:hypothetical protein
MLLHKSTAIGLAAAALSLGLAYTADPAKADVLPVTNLGFNQFTGTFTAPKTLFTTAAPTGWSIGAAAQLSNLIGVGNQGSEGSSQGVYAVYGTFSNRPAPTSIRRTATRSSRARSSRPLQV